MLRSMCVLLLIAFGLYYTLQETFYAIISYLTYFDIGPGQGLWTNIIAGNFLFDLGACVVLAGVFSGQRFILHRRILLVGIFLLQTLVSLLRSDYFAYGWHVWQKFFQSVQGWLSLITAPAWGANPNKSSFPGDHNVVPVGMPLEISLIVFIVGVGLLFRRMRCSGTISG